MRLEGEGWQAAVATRNLLEKTRRNGWCIHHRGGLRVGSRGPFELGWGDVVRLEGHGAGEDIRAVAVQGETLCPHRLYGAQAKTR